MTLCRYEGCRASQEMQTSVEIRDSKIEAVNLQPAFTEPFLPPAFHDGVVGFGTGAETT
jgi:hypothetical protein